MQILGIQGSPRKQGNSHHLLREVLGACEDQGAQTHWIQAGEDGIEPCRELLVCEKKGFCPIRDEMASVYGQIYRADAIVLASPVFFYNVSAQLKVLIDRCQMFWGRRYKLGLAHPRATLRRGSLLAVAASQGNRLFEGLELTARYFFDAVSARDFPPILHRGVEAAGEIRGAPGLEGEVLTLARKLTRPLHEMDHLLFISRQDAFIGPMAAAYANVYAKGRLHAHSAGIQPRKAVKEDMLIAMAGEKLDLKYTLPQHLDGVSAQWFSRRLPRWVVVTHPDIPRDILPGVRAMRMDVLNRGGDPRALCRQVAEGVARVMARLDGGD